MILFACYMMRKLKNCGIGILGSNENEIFCTDQQLMTPPFLLIISNILLCKTWKTGTSLDLYTEYKFTASSSLE